ncbi:prolipoprotein diacylglyceryl transferase [Curvibacter sp. CHRR-16]|uniref:prolipoprotein diacylglyceryl transferase n=1 Tax=Curvibacter sp. CHRR-16 TaxID=2835872 RepID=UPI001BD96641|nr:prolipoprotein diacylglyceryl transferase [Curvibacter sp. CHRR-16]MBT0570674.1 prolipoprotein diacylglyceryl transferase [Curvibacter sp. CHRR-16]
MLVYPGFDPVAIRLGPLAVHWYGITYLVAFALFIALGRLRLRHEPYASLSWNKAVVEDILFYGVAGVILGGRLGYCLFYKPAYYLSNPLEVFAIWQGGMSFHGGMLGVIAAMVLFAYRRGIPFWVLADFVAPCVPTGLASGRVGNFINGELWGRVADASLPWAMVFPAAGNVPRHPSQIYQFLLEGLLLFVVLWWYAPRAKDPGKVAAAFLLGYGVMRFVAEFFREPDAFLGLLSLGMSMGQWLCVPMIVGGAVLWLWHDRRARA